MLHNIAKKVDDRYIVWFEKSNRWIQLEEPAWFINILYQKGVDNVSISRKLSQKYNITPHICGPLVDEICESISALSKPNSNAAIDFSSYYYPTVYCNKPYAIRNYLIGSKYFRITFETRLAEYYIHPPMAHLETIYCGEPDIRFEIQSNADIPVLIEQDNVTLAFEDFMRLKKRLYIRMVNAIYKMTNNDWLSFVHASALTDGKQTILLSSASGSGKSTMAALLQTKGLAFVSDDFVPIDAKNKHAFPFPAAISIKKGSFDMLKPYYGDLNSERYNSYEDSGRSTRYLAPKANDLADFTARPVENIVFIRYNPNVACNFNLLPQNEAFRLFHDQAWVSGDPHHAKVFINWFLKLRCYRLEYGNTSEAINKILGIFETKIL